MDPTRHRKIAIQLLFEIPYKPLISDGPGAGVNRALPGTSAVWAGGAPCKAEGAAGAVSAGGGAIGAGAGAGVSCEAP
jgi:hypothetical protein